MSRPTRSRLLAALCAALLASPTWAVEATLMGAEITRDEPGERPGLFLASHYEFDLPGPLVDVLHRGIALYFNHEFLLERSRWYWVDKEVIDDRFVVRLSFDPLTRRYRVAYNGISLNFDSLEQAMPFVKNIRRWRVGPSSVLSADGDYTARVRFLLDATKLPKPMQVTSGDSDEWTVESSWSELPVTSDLFDAGE